LARGGKDLSRVFMESVGPALPTLLLILVLSRHRGFANIALINSFGKPKALNPKGCARIIVPFPPNQLGVMGLSKFMLGLKVLRAV
jgi:hypothetical protein